MTSRVKSSRLLLAVIALIMLLFVGITVSAQQSRQLPVLCTSDWYLSTDRRILDQCAIAKAAILYAIEVQEATQAVLNPTRVLPTPPAVSPTSFNTPTALAIQALQPGEFVDGPPWLRGSNSIWIIRELQTTNPYITNQLYALTRRPEAGQYASLAIVLDGPQVSNADLELYDHIWYTPYDVGVLTITNVTAPTTSANGLTGTIYFTTSEGGTGRFNLVTRAWIFNP